MNDYISIGDFIGQVNKEVPGSPMQTQYLARYLTGMPGYPDLGKDLRIKSKYYDKQRELLNYYEVTIHKDDLPVFIQRLESYYLVMNWR